MRNYVFQIHFLLDHELSADMNDSFMLLPGRIFRKNIHCADIPAYLETQ